MKWFALVKIDDRLYRLEFEERSETVTLAHAKEKMSELARQIFGDRNYRIIGPFSEIITPEPGKRDLSL